MARQLPIITQAIPNLVGGVSQQAAAVRNVTQCEEMTNAFPSLIEGLIKRPPLTKVAEFRKQSDNSLLALGSDTAALPHLIIRDLNERYICLIHPDEIYVYDLNGTRKSVYYDTNAKNYLTGATRSSLKAMTVADVTFVANTDTTVAMDAAKTTAIAYDRIALVHVLQDNYAREFKVVLSNSTNTGFVSFVYTSPSNNSGSHNLGTTHVATELATAINGSNGYAASAVDGVLKITRTGGTSLAFEISVEDDFGGDGMTLIRDRVQLFSDLPPTAPHGHVVKVEGAPESGIDDYYVKFEAEDGVFSKGVWIETVKPDIKYKYDYSKMPHILIRQSDGTFMFKKADGTTPASNVPAGANYSSFKWAERIVGDEDTNSDPTFVGDKIVNMVLFKNRLGFLSGENIILSEVSEFFNFWKTTMVSVPDGDPIDVASNSSKIAVMKSALVFNTELLLFTESSQLVLRGGEILSPRSVSIATVGDYEGYADVQPVSSGSSVFFGFNRGNGYTGIRELVPQPNIDGLYIVNTVSDLVPKYIPGKPIHLCSTTQEDLLGVVADNDLYMYKYLRSGDGVLQAAWFKFTFPDVATGGKAKVLWAEFVDSTLYVLVLRNTARNPVLEKMKMGVDQNDSDTVSGSNWLSHLDTKTYFASGAGSYNSTTGLTTWTLSKPYSYSSALTYISTTNGLKITASGGTSYNPTGDVAGTVTATGDYSTTPVWIGYKYPMTFQFSTVWLQSSAGRGAAALQTGRTQLRNMNLLYEDTGFFKVETAISPDNIQYEYPYSGNILGLTTLNQIYLNSGTFRFPIYGKNTETTIKITNDTPMPCKILSAEIEMDYTDRAMRFS